MVDIPRNLTKIDRLAISFEHDISSAIAFLNQNFGHLGTLDWKTMGGMLGFKQSMTISCSGVPVARIAFGGTSQKNRAYMDVSGVGCGLVNSWENMENSITESLPNSVIKRVDIAADYYKNEVTYENVYDAYLAGSFKRAGRPPKMRQILPGSSDEGRTIYIGVREADTFFRGYEKGKKEFGELLLRSDIPLGQVPLSSVTHAIDGEDLYLGDWFRCELELKSKTREFPQDIITNRDSYFAGTYPYLAEILESAEPRTICSQKKLAMSELDLALQHIKRQYGSTLYTALHAMDGDISALINRIVGDKHNTRLVEAGLFLPD